MVEKTYSHVQKEDIRQAIMLIGIKITSVVMAFKGAKMGQPLTF